MKLTRTEWNNGSRRIAVETESDDNADQCQEKSQQCSIQSRVLCRRPLFCSVRSVQFAFHAHSMFHTDRFANDPQGTSDSGELDPRLAGDWSIRRLMWEYYPTHADF